MYKRAMMLVRAMSSMIVFSLQVMLASLLLLVLGGVGAYFLIDPVGLAEKVSRRGVHIPILDYAETKVGRIQLRVMGLVFILVTLLFLFGILSAALGGKELRGALYNPRVRSISQAGYSSQRIVLGQLK
jgi:hypothetical protein